MLKARADAMVDTSRATNVYTCRVLAEVPKGAGAWAQSDFVKDARNANTRFFAYPGGEEDKLAADAGALRPLAEKGPEAAKGRETALYMAYDTYGWHVFIRSDEPEIEQIMLEDGRRGSTLEMFFAPGLKGQVYYQWLIHLAQAKTDIYHWNTPHRFYRYLENRVGSLQTDTAVLKTGWGTAITIAWEALYDKLPFLEGNEDTWRFSTMRWGPVSMTWGGTVHETGRWGMVKWQPPAPAQLLDIQRHIVRKAWWRYQASKAQLTEFWKGARGDQAFYDGVLAPFFTKRRPVAIGVRPGVAVGAVEGDAVVRPEVLLRKPLGREVAELDEGADAVLEGDLALRVVGRGMAVLQPLAAVDVADDPRGPLAAVEPENVVHQVRAELREPGPRRGVDADEFANLAPLVDGLGLAPLLAVLLLVGDDEPDARLGAQVADAAGLGQRRGHRLLERDGLHAVANAHLDQLGPHLGRRDEAEDVGPLHRQHQLRVGIRLPDAVFPGHGGEAFLIDVADGHEVEAVGVSLKPLDMPLPPRPAADLGNAILRH